MSNVIEVNFTAIIEDSGYVINGQEVDGVYKGNIVAVRKSDSDSDCVIGLRGDSQVFNPIDTSIDDLNEFCLMWLLIFNPDVIKEEGEQ